MDRPATRIEVTQVPKEAGDIIDDILDRIYTEITAKPIKTDRKSMKELIPHIYNETYKIHQGKCFMQNSPNLCGYHAIFNTFCFLKMFNGGET